MANSEADGEPLHHRYTRICSWYMFITGNVITEYAPDLRANIILSLELITRRGDKFLYSIRGNSTGIYNK